MRLFSLGAIFFLFWFISLFAVLPFGMRTSEEAGSKPEPGHAESAPHVFRPWPIVLRTTIAAAILTVLFYAAYRQGWLDVPIPQGTTIEAGHIER
jgi:predicted secreted protein